MDALTAFGLFAVTAMLVCYALEDYSPWFVLSFAGSCALGLPTDFCKGAWPFGVVEAIWSVVALRRWAKTNRAALGHRSKIADQIHFSCGPGGTHRVRSQHSKATTYTLIKLGSLQHFDVSNQGVIDMNQRLSARLFGRPASIYH